MKPKRKKIRFRAGQKVLVLTEKGIEEFTIPMTIYAEEYIVTLRPANDEESACWVEIWQIAKTREQLVKQIHEHADAEIQMLEDKKKVWEDFKEKFK